MIKLHIDINAGPPTKDFLAYLRHYNEVTLRETKIREPVLDRVIFGVSTLLFIGYLMLRGGDIQNLGMLLGASAGIVVAMLLFRPAVSGIVVGFVMGALSFDSVNVLVPDTPRLGLLASLVGVSLVSVLLSWLYSIHIVRPRAAARRVLACLSELDTELHPQSAVEFDGMRRTYPQIATYYEDILAQGRKPVLAEFEAARTWIKECGTLSYDSQLVDSR